MPSLISNISQSSEVPQYVSSAVLVKLPAELENVQYSFEASVALSAAWKAGRECLLPMRSQIIRDSQGVEPQTSQADYAANEKIYSTLKQHFPSDGYISQEGAPLAPAMPHLKTERSWVVDPLDGTGTYAEGDTDEYGIHIALVDHATGEVVVGVNYYPAQDITYFAIKSHGAFKQKGAASAEKLRVPPHSDAIHAYKATRTPLINKIYDHLENVSFTPCFSCGLRIVSMTDTAQNLYITSGNNTQCGKASGPVRFTATWDIASGSLILKEAGGVVAYIDGSPIDFLAADGRLTQTVIVTSDRALYDQIQQIFY